MFYHIMNLRKVWGPKVICATWYAVLITLLSSPTLARNVSRKFLQTRGPGASTEPGLTADRWLTEREDTTLGHWQH